MRRKTILALLLAAVLLPAGLALRAQEEGRDLDEMIERLKKALAERQGRAGEPPTGYVRRMYDVRDLTTPVRDYPGEEFQLTPSGGFGFGFFEEAESEPVVFYHGDVIVDMILENVAPTSWDELRSVRIDYVAGFLSVTHLPAVQERIGAMLDELRSRAASQVTLECRWLRIPDRALRAVLGTGSACTLDQSAELRLNRMIESGAAEIVDGGSVTCVNTQRVALTNVGSVSYVQDHDVEIAQEAEIPDPIVQQVREGSVVDVRPVIAGRGEFVILEVRADFGKLRRPIETADTKVGTIEVPRLSLLRVRTMVATPVGRPAVVGGCLADGEEHSLLLLVTPTVHRPGS